MRKKRVMRRKVNKIRKKGKAGKSSIYIRMAYLQGLNRANARKDEHDLSDRSLMNREWVEWLRTKRMKSWQMYHYTSQQFLKGWCNAANLPIPDAVLLPTVKTAAAIVSVQNEEKTLGQVLHQLNRMALAEVIVVINGTTDQSFHIARQYANVVIVNYPQALGHDVGRAVGAKLSNSEILLFLDADFVIPATELVPFIYGIERGYDLALNNITPYLGHFSNWDGVTIMKHFMNTALGRKDFNANSLTAVPHAMSRTALEVIGVSNLMVPPKAQQIAMQQNLRVFAPASINVITKNKARKNNTGQRNPVLDLIVGDHMEAMQPLLAQDHRLGFADLLRKRDVLN